MSANILNTFYLLFKSNVKDQTKAMDEADTAGKKLKKTLTEEEKAAQELGKQFVKITEGITSAVTAYISFGAIKNGIVNVTSFNTALERTGQVTGQNVRDLAIYGRALEQFGGTAEGFQSTVKTMTAAAALQGRQLPPLAGFLKEVNLQLQGLSLNESSRVAQMMGYGIEDPAMLNLLRQTSSEYDKIIARQKELNGTTEQGTAAALQFSQEWANVGTVFSGVFSHIGEDVLPPLTGMLKAVQDLGMFIRGDSILSVSFLSALALGFTALSATIVGMIRALAGVGGATAALLAPFLALGAQILGIVAIAEAIPTYAFKGGQAIGNWIKGSPQGQSSIDFWKSQGYSADQAAGIEANMHRESGGNPGAVGDGGAARGLFQWHPDRRARILAATGIDVATASRDDQLKAAAWELQDSGVGDRLKQARSPGEAASMFSRLFERPANGDYEASIRGVMAGKIALDTASTSPYSSSNVNSRGGDRNISVKVGDVNIHTQATSSDGISGDIAQGLTQQVQTAISNYDDGVAM